MCSHLLFSKKNIKDLVEKGGIPFFKDPDNTVYDRSASIVLLTPTAASVGQITAPRLNRMDRNTESNGENLMDIARDCIGKFCPILTRKLKVDGGKKRKKKRNTKKYKKNTL